MLMVLAGAATALVAFVFGAVVGIKFGTKMTYQLLEREGRLIPVTPPAVVRDPDVKSD